MLPAVIKVTAIAIVLEILSTLSAAFTDTEPKPLWIAGGAIVFTLGAGWYTMGRRFPGALSSGPAGGWAGLLGATFAVGLITGLWGAVEQRLAPETWNAGGLLTVVLYFLTFIVGCTLAFWCITEVVLRDRARKSSKV